MQFFPRFFQDFSKIFYTIFCRGINCFIFLKNKITRLDKVNWVNLLKMSEYLSKKVQKKPKIFFQDCIQIVVFCSIFSATINPIFSSRFFSAPKKHFFEEIKFGHLSIFKNVHFQKVILSSTKKGGIRLDRHFQNIFVIFYPHNVGILVFCRRTDHRQVRPTRM